MESLALRFKSQNAALKVFWELRMKPFTMATEGNQSQH